MVVISSRALRNRRRFSSSEMGGSARARKATRQRRAASRADGRRTEAIRRQGLKKRQASPDGAKHSVFDAVSELLPPCAIVSVRKSVHLKPAGIA